MLVGWEELTPAQAARVLGITSLAARSRLHRARRRLRERLSEGETTAVVENRLEAREVRR
jgi:RNA polymerase sigma-70 factor (ECF subfamily)